MMKLLSAFLVFASFSASALAFEQEKSAIQDGVYERTKRHVSVVILPAEKEGCYQISLFDYNSLKYQVEITMCGITTENTPAKRAEVISIISRSILETDERIARKLIANAQTSSADAADIAILDGRGARIGRSSNGMFIDIWVQAPGIVTYRSRDGEVKTQWLRTRFMVKSTSESPGEKASVAKINATVWESSIIGNRDGVISAAGLFRIGTLKLIGGSLTMADQSTQYLSNVEVELAGLSYASTYDFTDKLGLYFVGAVGFGMRIIDQNSPKLSYASPIDLRMGFIISDKLYFGAKAEAAMGGDTLREALGGELRYHSKRGTFGAAIERVEHNGADALVTDPNGWNVNFGYFGRF